ncbi:hypothetical protein ACP70R_010760 [Stipagrostis hirtigluma subsp. patula]
MGQSALTCSAAPPWQWRRPETVVVVVVVGVGGGHVFWNPMHPEERRGFRGAEGGGEGGVAFSGDLVGDSRGGGIFSEMLNKSVRDEGHVLRAVQSAHAMIDREIAAGTNAEDVFVFGLSQGGALSIASVLLYPKTLGGCAVFSGFLPFNSSFAAKVTAEAKNTPVLWIHGGADSLTPIEAGRDEAKFLRGLGMSCELKVYETLGHTLAPFELEYCERWASEKILN